MYKECKYNGSIINNDNSPCRECNRFVRKVTTLPFLEELVKIEQKRDETMRNIANWLNDYVLSTVTIYEAEYPDTGIGEFFYDEEDRRLKFTEEGK